MTYQTLLCTARSLANGAEETWLKLMVLLVKTEAKKDVWVGNPHGIKTWPELLQAEGLCTARHYRMFKEAYSELGAALVKQFGAYASIRIAQIEPIARKKIVRTATAWIQKHRVRPTYQRITEYIKHETAGPKASKKRSYKREVGELTDHLRNQGALVKELRAKVRQQAKYIRTLKDALKSNNVSVPKA
jgi:hypothetical protein